MSAVARRWWLGSLMAFLALNLPLGGVTVDDLRVTASLTAGREFTSGGTVEENSTGSPSPTMVSTHADGTANYHARQALVYRRSLRDLRDSFGSLAYGFELANDLVREDANGLDFRGHSEMVDLFLGWAWKVSPSWHVEEGILLGLARSRWSQQVVGFYPDGDTWSDESEGFTTEYGFDIAAIYSYDQHWQFGVDLRHLVMDTHVKFTGQHLSTDPSDPFGRTSADANWKFTIEGFNLSAQLGYRF